MPVPSNSWRLRHAAGKAASKLIRHIEGSSKKLATPVTVSSAQSSNEQNAAPATNATPAALADYVSVAKVRAQSWNVIIRPLSKPNGVMSLPGARDVVGIYQPDGWNNEDVDRRNFARLQRSQTVIGKRRAEFVENLLLSAYGEKKAQTDEPKNTWNGYTYQDVFKQLGSTFKYFQQTTLHSSPSGIGKNLSIGSVETGKVYNLNFESRIRSPARSVVEKGDYVFFLHDPARCPHGSTEADHYPFENQPCCEYFPLIPQDGSDLADTVASVDGISMPNDARRKVTRQRDGRCVVSTSSYTIGEVDFGGSALQVAHVVPQSTPQEWSQAMQLAVASQRFATRKSKGAYNTLQSLLPSSYSPPLINLQCLENLLLLRSDLHFLFDTWLWSIHPGNKRVVPFASLGASMADYEGVCIAHNSDNPLCLPPKAVLEWHYDYCWSQMLLAQPGPGFPKYSASRESVVDGELGVNKEQQSIQLLENEMADLKRVDGQDSTKQPPSSTSTKQSVQEFQSQVTTSSISPEGDKSIIPNLSQIYDLASSVADTGRQEPIYVELYILVKYITFLKVTRDRAEREHNYAQKDLDGFLRGRQRRLRNRRSNQGPLDEHEHRATNKLRRKVSMFERIINFTTEYILLFENFQRKCNALSKHTSSTPEDNGKAEVIATSGNPDMVGKVEIPWHQCMTAMTKLRSILFGMKSYQKDLEHELKWYLDTKTRLTEAKEGIEASRALSFFKKAEDKIKDTTRRIEAARSMKDRIHQHTDTLASWMSLNLEGADQTSTDLNPTAIAHINESEVEGDVENGRSPIPAAEANTKTTTVEGGETVEVSMQEEVEIEGESLAADAKASKSSKATTTPAKGKVPKREAAKETKTITEAQKKESKAAASSKTTSATSTPQVSERGAKLAALESISLAAYRLKFDNTYLKAITQLLKDVPELIIPDIEDQIRTVKEDGDDQDPKSNRKRARQITKHERTILHMADAHKQMLKEHSILKGTCSEPPELAGSGSFEITLSRPEVRQVADAYVINICRQIDQLIRTRQGIMSKGNSMSHEQTEAALENYHKISNINTKIQARFRQLESIVPSKDVRRQISEKIFKKPIYEIIVGASSEASVNITLMQKAAAAARKFASTSKKVSDDSAQGVLNSLNDEFRKTDDGSADIRAEESEKDPEQELEEEKDVAQELKQDSEQQIEREYQQELEQEPEQVSEHELEEESEPDSELEQSFAGESENLATAEPIKLREISYRALSLGNRYSTVRKSGHATSLLRLKKKMSQGEIPTFEAKTGSLYQSLGFVTPPRDQIQKLFGQNIVDGQIPESKETQPKASTTQFSVQPRYIKGLDQGLSDGEGEYKIVSEGTLGMPDDQPASESADNHLRLWYGASDLRFSNNAYNQMKKKKAEEHAVEPASDEGSIGSKFTSSTQPSESFPEINETGKLLEGGIIKDQQMTSDLENGKTPTTEKSFSSFEALQNVVFTTRGYEVLEDTIISKPRSVREPDYDLKERKHGRSKDAVTPSPSDVLQDALEKAANLSNLLEQHESDKEKREEEEMALASSATTTTTKDSKASPRKILQDWAAKQIEELSTTVPPNDAPTVATVITSQEEIIVESEAAETKPEDVIEEKEAPLETITKDDKADEAPLESTSENKSDEHVESEAEQVPSETLSESKPDEDLKLKSVQEAKPEEEAEEVKEKVEAKAEEKVEAQPETKLEEEEEKAKTEGSESRQSESTAEKPKAGGWGSWFSMFK